MTFVNFRAFTVAAAELHHLLGLYPLSPPRVDKR